MKEPLCYYTVFDLQPCILKADGASLPVDHIHLQSCSRAAYNHNLYSPVSRRSSDRSAVGFHCASLFGFMNPYCPLFCHLLVRIDWTRVLGCHTIHMPYIVNYVVLWDMKWCVDAVGETGAGHRSTVRPEQLDIYHAAPHRLV